MFQPKCDQLFAVLFDPRLTLTDTIDWVTVTASAQAEIHLILAQCQVCSGIWAHTTFASARGVASPDEARMHSRSDQKLYNQFGRRPYQ